MSDEAFLREFLATRDVPCAGCGYNLRGLTGTRCPECSQELVLRVGLVEPRMRLWIAGLVGLAAGAGLNGLLLVYAGMMIVRGGFSGFIEPFAVYNAAGLAVEATLVGAWLWWGRKIRRWTIGARRALAAAAWGLSVLNIVLFARVID